MESIKVAEVASEYLHTRIKEYELYCVCKQIRCVLPSELERDAVFKYLIDGNVWDDPGLTEEKIREKINTYFLELLSSRCS